MPRVVNATVAALLLLVLVPVAVRLGDVSAGARVLVLLLTIPFALLALLCLLSAARPGILGRLAQRAKQQR